MYNKNSILINMASQAAGTVAPILVTFFTTPIIIRLLGAEGYGLQNLAAVVGGFLGFLNMGLDVPIAKFLAQYKATEDVKSMTSLLDTTLFMYMCIGLTGALVLAIVSKPLAFDVFKLTEELSHAARIVFLLAGVSFLLSLIQSWANACLIGLERFDLVNVANVAVGLISPLVGIAAVYAGYGIVGFVAARVGVMGLGVIVSFLLSLNHLSGYRPSPKFHLPSFLSIRGYLGAGVTLRINGWVSGGLDRTLIGSWVSVSGVAAYTLQWSLIVPIQSLLSNTFGYLFPMASSLYAKGAVEEFKEVFLKAAKLYAALTCTAFGVLFVSGVDFLSLWVGVDLANQVRVAFPLLVVAMGITTLGSWFLNSIALGTTNLGLYFRFTWAKVILLGLSLPLGVWLFGLPGAAGAYLIPCVSEIPYISVVVRRIIGFPLKNFVVEIYARPLVPTILLCSIFRLYIIFPVQTWLHIGLISSIFVLLLWGMYLLCGVYNFSYVLLLARNARTFLFNLSRNSA